MLCGSSEAARPPTILTPHLLLKLSDPLSHCLSPRPEVSLDTGLGLIWFLWKLALELGVDRGAESPQQGPPSPLTCPPRRQAEAEGAGAPEKLGPPEVARPETQCAA